MGNNRRERMQKKQIDKKIVALGVSADVVVYGTTYAANRYKKKQSRMQHLRNNPPTKRAPLTPPQKKAQEDALRRRPHQHQVLLFFYQSVFSSCVPCDCFPCT